MPIPMLPECLYPEYCARSGQCESWLRTHEGCVVRRMRVERQAEDILWFRFLDARAELVHYWHAQGKTFDDISVLLSCPPAQVERIFRGTTLESGSRNKE